MTFSAVIATRNRAQILRRTLESLALQSIQPAELVIVDASDNKETQTVCATVITSLPVKVWWFPAHMRGAASQRNEGVTRATQTYVLFMDDDILFEPGCLARMFQAMEADAQLGGVNAMISNQRYHPPGLASRLLYRLLHGRTETSYAGRIIGPGMNLLPEDRSDLPEVVQVEWLNTTCTLYRHEALPDPPFAEHFTGYSLLEDATLSRRVAQRGWKLANARTARIFHDSQPGDHKNDPAEMSRMALVNRHYFMTEVLGRHRFTDYLKLALLEGFSLLAALPHPRSRANLPALLKGKLVGARELFAKHGLPPG